jgi:hypothetical protein
VTAEADEEAEGGADKRGMGCLLDGFGCGAEGCLSAALPCLALVILWLCR